MTLFTVTAFILVCMHFYIKTKQRPVVAEGDARTPEQIYQAYALSQTSTSNSEFRPYRLGTSRRVAKAYEQLQMRRDSVSQGRANERNFLVRDLNFTDRELRLFDKIIEDHEKSISEITERGSQMHSAVKSLFSKRKEALVKLMGVKRYGTYQSYRKSQNTNTDT